MNETHIQLDLTRRKVVVVGAPHVIDRDLFDIINAETGFWMLDLDGHNGWVEAWVLRAIADLLDEANREWEEQLDKAYRE
jgi:hypothetical protein